MTENLAAGQLIIAIQMDPVDGIDIDADSTFAMALEAQARGHQLFHYLPADLSFQDGAVTAFARPLELRRDYDNYATLGKGSILDLRKIDVVLMRQDPPFDMAYITATHILEHIHPDTLVVNDPAHVRNAPEKLFSTWFEGLMPPTLITRRREDVSAFREQYKDIIIKPLYGNGGAGVFHIKPDDDNINALLEMFAAGSREPIMVQKYLPEIREGDKRIILVDGEAVGALNRVPSEGEARSNLHVGGTAQQSDLSARDQEICAAIGPALRERGLIFVGIDVIGDYLTEINVTSPTGIQEIDRFSGTNISSLIWDAIEAKISAR